MATICEQIMEGQTCGKVHSGECSAIRSPPSTLRPSQKKELADIANSLVSSGKGIYAADQSIATMAKRFAKVGLKNDEELRRKFRQLLFTTGKDAFNHISGVIIMHETLYQRDDNGVPLVKHIKDNGAWVGIKVDKGVVLLPGTEGETTTQGLDGLEERGKKYKLDGCDFAKWRANFVIGERTPSQLAIVENCNALARFAVCCQQAGLVPLLEPEILSNGDHPLSATEYVLEKILTHVYRALMDHHVWLEGTLLRVNMVLAGADCTLSYTPYEIAGSTLVVLHRTVPACVPGIFLLSGDQADEEASTNLDAINKFPGKKPWLLSFCFGRALQVAFPRCLFGLGTRTTLPPRNQSSPKEQESTDWLRLESTRESSRERRTERLFPQWSSFTNQNSSCVRKKNVSR